MTIAQVDDSRFSQVYKDWQEPLKPSHSALEHYLFFKGFTAYAMGYKDIPEGDWRDGVVSLIRHITIPYHSTGLLGKDWDTNKLSGFAAVRTDKGIEVYEFDKVSLPDELIRRYFFGEEVAYAAHAIDLHRKKPQDNIKVYKSNDAITRLHEFKTERRF